MTLTQTNRPAAENNSCTLGAASAVSRHWGTPVLTIELPVDDIIGAGLDGLGADGPAFEIVETQQALTDPQRLAAEFCASFEALAAIYPEDIRPSVTGASVEVQVWRHGYDEPAAGHGADFVGWCVLAADGERTHTESGALTLADPRAGSAMTAMPGLPWGRQLMIRPVVGAHLAAPGWLTSSVVPLERGQYVVAAFAKSVR